MKTKKRGQITPFIIIGIVLLLSLIFFVYFQSFFLQPDLVPDELDPITNYVHECLKITANQGITILGQQGGYIKIPLNIDFNPSKYVNPDKLGLVKLPYWYYRGQRNAPSISSVQRQLSDYVEENLENCLDNFKPFNEQYSIQKPNTIEVETFLNRNDVSLELTYPIKVNYKNNNTITEIEKFTTKVNVRLRKILEMAYEILDNEVQETFLEKFTIDLMASNQKFPFTDMTFSCTPKTWRMDQLENELKFNLYTNIPRIRIKNTDYPDFIADESVYEKLEKYTIQDMQEGNRPKNVPEDAYEYLHMFWDANLEEDKTISAGLYFYQNSNIDFVAKPSSNGLLRSKVVQGNDEFIPFFCINQYHFTYDINYPIIVSLRDSISYTGEGYSFNFAMPVNIRDNAPFKDDYYNVHFESTYYNERFCQQRNNEETEIRVIGKDGNLLNMELKDVNLTMKCISFECPLGPTFLQEGSYKLITQLPSGCSNPFIVAQKSGYLDTRKQLTSNELTINMKKLKTFNYEILVHRYNSIANRIEAGEPLRQDQTISIRIGNDDLSQFISEQQTFELIDGEATYDLDIILTEDDEYIGGFIGEWSPNNVYEGQKVIFHVVKYVPVAYTQEDKIKMMEYLITGSYKSQLQPTIT